METSTAESPTSLLQDPRRNFGGWAADDPRAVALAKRLRIDELPLVEPERLLSEPLNWLTPSAGQARAVDMRAMFGPARDQGRGACTAFAAVAVAEGLEFLRDARPGPRCLSEELVYWYSMGGRLKSGADGYSASGALQHLVDVGTCAGRDLPYRGVFHGRNVAHVPVSDEAIDGMAAYRFHAVASVKTGTGPNEVERLKAVLRSGRCAALSHDTTGWDDGDGVIRMSSPPDLRGPGGAHATTAFGFIDRDDLPASYEGGFFLVRNSWGGHWKGTHIWKRNYDGHCLMPYGWYRRYVSAAHTLFDATTAGGPGALQWRAEYFANTLLAGLPARTEERAGLASNWGSGGPLTGRSDDFSARFTRIRRLRPGWHRFTLRGDDGVRLWVDDRLVINAWRDQSATAYRADHCVEGGDHVLRVEYFEHKGGAELGLEVEPLQWHYELFANDSWSGPPAQTFDDSNTALEWLHVPPVANTTTPGVFSLRARLRKHFPEGNCVFHAMHTGKCRVLLDGIVVFDDFGARPVGTACHVAAGEHDVVVEFVNLAVPEGNLVLTGDVELPWYQAKLWFGWSDTAWTFRVHQDGDRNAAADAGAGPGHLGSAHTVFRVLSLRGAPFREDRCAVAEGHDEFKLRLEYIEGGHVREGSLDEVARHSWGLANADNLALHAFRRIYVGQRRRYRCALTADDAHRLVIDGRQISESHAPTQAFTQEYEVELGPGLHDISLEYANGGGNGTLKLDLQPIVWEVDYFSLAGPDSPRLSSTKVDRLAKALAAAPLGASGLGWTMRARRSLMAPFGTYAAHVVSADGVRLRADGDLLLDAWTATRAAQRTANIQHLGGDLMLEVDHRSAPRDANASEYPAPPPGEWDDRALDLQLIPRGFFGEIYRGKNLEIAQPGSGLDRNVPVAFRHESAVRFDVGSGALYPRQGADGFSSRWTGRVELPVGRWEFVVEADDGVRLFIDGQLVVDSWQDQPATAHRHVADLVGRSYELVLEHYENAGSAACRLDYRRLV